MEVTTLLPQWDVSAVVINTTVVMDGHRTNIIPDYPPVVTIGVPLICIIVFSITLVIIYLLPHTVGEPDTPKSPHKPRRKSSRREACELDHQVELQVEGHPVSIV